MLRRPCRRRAANLIWAVAILAALALVAAAPAPARSGLETALVPNDDFTGPDGSLAFARIRGTGSSAARLYIFWRDVAPTTPPTGFDPENPADPAYDWSTPDREITLAVAAGLEPIVNVNAAPDWAQGAGTGAPGSVRPDPAKLAQFARAAARRYGGSYGGLPRVRRWEVWNEPNHFFFLNPQIENGQVVSAQHYRAMVNAFADAVHGEHADNVVIAGDTAPFTGAVPSRYVTGPLRFMRALLCLSGSSAPRVTCAERVHFDVWSTHPYTTGGPTHHATGADDVSLGDLKEMRDLLRAGVRTGQVVSAHPVGFWVTEFSWDSNPPDPGGVPTRLHARWVSEALYRMWRAGVRLVAWFQLRDDANDGHPQRQLFQSGLYFRCSTGLSCDRPKRALEAFRFPFVAFRSTRKRVAVWGRTPFGRRRAVIIEQRAGTRWLRLAKLGSNRHGIFVKRLRTRRRGSLRARLVRKHERSIPFSLTRPPDQQFYPFGG
jgi:hypothetical protein